jgi:hypothetical protein
VNGLRLMAALKAARDFGLEPEHAAEIARGRDSHDAIVDALARALVASGAVRVPDAA